MENKIYQLPEFIKHVPVANRADYIYDKLYKTGSRYSVTDHSQFEAHFTRNIMEHIEFVVYRYLIQNLPNKEDYEQLFKVLQGKNKCCFKKGHYIVNATRMSGEMNTSLGNGLTNLLLMLYVLNQNGNTNVSGVVEGDDGLFRYDGPDPTKDMFAKMGFTVKLEIFDNLNEASFCGLVFDIDARQIIINPIKVLLNFGWLHYQYKDAKFETIMGLLRMKSLSLLYQYPSCPIVSELALYGLRVTSKYTPVLIRENNYKRKFHEEVLRTPRLVADMINFKTRLVCEKVFKITIDDQLSIESYLKQLDEIKPLWHLSFHTYMNQYQDVYLQYVGEYAAGYHTVVPHKMVRRNRTKQQKKRNNSNNNNNNNNNSKKKEIVVVRQNNPKQTKSIGQQIGSALGGLIGHGAHMLFKNITGFGDYNINNNTLLQGGMTPPEVINTVREGGFVVRHREYIGDISPSQQFSSTVYSINPGNANTFPWLSQVADSFEQYEFRGLVFEFKSTSSDAVLSSAASSSLGTVIMATQYNSLSNPFTDKRTMENYEYANSDKPSMSFYHPVECKKSQTSIDLLYVRNTDAVNGDLRLYDLGQFQISTTGMQNTGGVIGELWCTFEIAFYKPKLLPSGTTCLTDHYRLDAITTDVWFGDTQTLMAGSNIGTNITTGGTRIQFPATLSTGKFSVVYSISSITGFNTPPTISGSGLNLLPLYNGGTTSTVIAAQSTLSTAIIGVTVQITDPNAYLDFVGGAIGAAAEGDLFISQIALEIT
ncbi:hypothetical protein 2 [Changjiang tombus-like virus 21]|uniref:hypothetical protein 2 n=1 Tax=Changjiang tombus-like virus 21 TaxID=1922815 RepID=UPI00090C0EF4|nr:hypothetical protein 2 [Changjiang tombus-like virus 21]APG76218.1 hypothetical protein 2 [Changjiang tombus-like virus 21]